MAERIHVASDMDVAGSVQRLTGAVQTAGARVFPTVDFSKASIHVGLDPKIFGSPRIGTDAMQGALETFSAAATGQ